MKIQNDMRRREVLKECAGAVFTLSLPILPSTASAQNDVNAKPPYSDPVAADKWLYPFLHAPGAVAGALHMGRFNDRIYYLDKEIRWKPGPSQKGPEVVVPAGFVTDLASIPRVFWSLLPTDGAYTFPAIVHDFLYWTQPCERKVADMVLRHGMDDMKVSGTVATAIYAAVRAGGAGPWSENQKLRAQGTKRMLKTFPTDPQTTWSEWSQKKDCCSYI